MDPYICGQYPRMTQSFWDYVNLDIWRCENTIPENKKGFFVWLLKAALCLYVVITFYIFL